jgi:hypothetical protein
MNSLKYFTAKIEELNEDQIDYLISQYKMVIKASCEDCGKDKGYRTKKPGDEEPILCVKCLNKRRKDAGTLE